MRFSVIIPSYLGDYRTAAQNREEKIVRAIKSVQDQSFQDFEIVVVADGCPETVRIVSGIKDERLKLYMITKSKIWSGVPRQTGIDNAKGDFIIYLDIDDVFGVNHLFNINRGLQDHDWVWFDDIRYHPKSGEWYTNSCDIRIVGRHGTSNICHKRTLSYKWQHSGYAHDYYFIKLLRQNHNMTKIEGGEYYVCHVPHSNIGKGYDL